jgi:hypothetical protein
MTEITRWKTIATIAVAFSAGNLFSTACQNAGGGKANAEDGTTEDGGDGSTPPPEVSAADLAELAEALVATEAEVASLKCFIGHMTDNRHEYDGVLETANSEKSWTQGPIGVSGGESDSSIAYEDCF